MGFLVWDVRKLVKEAEALPVISVPLSDITELDETYWCDHNGQSPTCRHIADHFVLVQQASLDFPMILCADGRLMDGMHRIVKAYCEGLTDIQAKKFLSTPAPDFIDVDLDDLSYDD